MYIINAKINTMDCCDRIIENGFIETDEGKILRVGAMEELSHIPENCTDAGGRCVFPQHRIGGSHFRSDHILAGSYLRILLLPNIRRGSTSDFSAAAKGEKDPPQAPKTVCCSCDRSDPSCCLEP